MAGLSEQVDLHNSYFVKKIKIGEKMGLPENGTHWVTANMYYPVGACAILK